MSGLPNRILSATSSFAHDPVGCTSLVSSSLSLIRSNSACNAFLSVFQESAEEEARQADFRYSRNIALSPIDGIPVAVKDNFVVESPVHSTTAGSKMLQNFKSPVTATVVERLRKAGAILVGKTNMDEFGMGSGSVNGAFGPVRNPRNLMLSAGGSSGGSAAAVAFGGCLAAIGSDTGGSIRLPASYCGVAGFKPSYGRLSRNGLIAYASSFDCPAITANSFEDIRLVFEQLDGQDPNDPTTLDFSKFDAQFGKALDTSKPLKVGIPEEFNIKELEDNVLDAWKKSIDSFCHAGHSVRQVSIPSIPYALPVYYILAAAEASSNLSRYTGLFYGFADTQDFSSLQEFFSRNRSSGFGDEVKKRILLGTFVLSSTHYQSFFVKAQKIRSKISEEFQKVFREVDVLLLPTGSSTAPPLTYFSENPDPLSSYLQDIMTVPANLAGLPCTSVPFHKSGQMPLGMQIIGPFGSDFRVLSSSQLLQNLVSE